MSSEGEEKHKGRDTESKVGETVCS
jgi:hypothetical protein